MSFDYNQSVWGKDTATLNPAHPTAIRLKFSLELISTLPANAKILEVGCGAGQFIRAIKQHFPNFECTGFDISEAAINQAKLKDDRVQYVAGEAARWPLPSQEFEAVVIYDVLEHVESVPATLLEINRVLKPGGKIYAFIPCEGDVLSFWHCLRFNKHLDSLTNKYAGHINRYSRAKWQQIFKEYNFQIEYKKYSEHFFGQLIGILAFYLMDKKAKANNLIQLNNEEYFGNFGGKDLKGKIFPVIKNLVNSVVYYESVLLQKIPSPNLHLVAKKMK